jgi:hypothetical protein
MAAAVIPLAAEPAAQNLQAIFFAPKFVMASTASAMAWSAVIWHLWAHPKDKGCWLPLALVVPIVLAGFVSSQWSVDPSRSHSISQTPLLGPWSWVVYGGMLIAVATFLRTKRQLDRLVWALLLPAFPIGLCVIMTNAGLMPQHLASNFLSPAGSPLFTASYLVLVLPLAIVQLGFQWEAAGRQLTRRAALSVLLTLVLAAAFIACEKRGPTLALAAAGCVAMVLLAILRRRIRWAAWSAALAVGCAGFLTVLAALQQAGFPMRELPMIRRLAMIVPMGEKTGDIFRQSLWGEAPGLIFREEPLQLAGIGTDPNHAWRPLIGYGPDTVEAVLPSQWIWLPAWPRPTIEVSTHSQFWDIFLCLGLLGLVTYWVLTNTVLRSGLVPLGYSFVRQRKIFSIAPLLGGVAGGVLLAWAKGWGFFGVGYVAGFLASHLIMSAAARGIGSEQRASSDLAFWAIGFMAALSGHLVDMAFFFPRGSSALLFAIFCGVALAMPRLLRDSTTGRGGDAGFHGAANVIIPISLLALFHSVLPPWQTDWAMFLQPVPLTATVVLVLATWLYGRESSREEPASGFIPGAGWVVITTVLLTTWLGLQAWGWPPVSPATQTDIQALLLPGVFLIGLSLLALLPLQKIFGRQRLPVYLAIFAAAAAWIWSANFLRGEVAAGIAVRSPQTGQILLKHALNLVPKNFRWRSYLAESLEIKRPPEADEGTTVLEEGMGFSGLNMLSMHLGKRQMQRAILATAPDGTGDSAADALAHFQQAAVYAPQNADAWFHAAMVADLFDLASRDQHLSWHRQSDIALAGRPPLMPKANLAEWGSYYTSQALSQSAKEPREAYALRAIRLLNKSIVKLIVELKHPEIGKRAKNVLSRTLFQNWLNKGHAHKLLHEYSKAAKAYDAASRVELEKLPLDPRSLAEECRRLAEKRDSEEK